MASVVSEFQASSGLLAMLAPIESASAKQAAISLVYAVTMDSVDSSIGNFISVRAHFLETAIIAVAEAVYNAALTVLYSAATLLTLGQVSAAKAGMKRHGFRTCIAIAAQIYGFAGTITPLLATKYVLAPMVLLGGSLASNFILNDIKKVARHIQQPEIRRSIASEGILGEVLVRQLHPDNVQDWNGVKGVVTNLFQAGVAYAQASAGGLGGNIPFNPQAQGYAD